ILPNILALGQLSGATNLLQFPGTGPMLGQGAVQVQPAGSQSLAQAQAALGCAPGGATTATLGAGAGAIAAAAGGAPGGGATPVATAPAAN
ncbi:UNVERIFIED_CONTAM: hypothetical protein HDU68_006988, partial [Siphonaria sp. JEL0065]